ncbi:hypothetical protein O6H91_23G064800 [Diphasiastrum complanatum]|uniref:Uncharacterized protein n=1 Tax=Diphasiastrum complanatum TaxID=34168 RepID=A0ACC2ABC2_DIPCM|nr:hypothetical protein O6H91_23G064800 [Diphasiastrum complanatum]
MDQTWQKCVLGRESIHVFSAKYYAACAAGGMLSAGTTHFLVTPFDMLKVNMQVNPLKYRSILTGLEVLWKEQGVAGLWKGWSGKLCGYGTQGACRFGLYEYFKKQIRDNAESSYMPSNRTATYVAASASAGIIADVALCPFEAVKVRVQAQPLFAKGLVDGFPKFYSSEGIFGFYKGLLPLWARSTPFTILMFSSFEHSVDLLYSHVIKRPKIKCSKGTQLGVTCAAGYFSGMVGTIITNPADNVISYLNNNDGTVLQAVKQIGLVGLFTRSLPLRIMLVGPVVTMQWFIYDLLKVSIGLPTSGDLDGGISEQNEDNKVCNLLPHIDH